MAEKDEKKKRDYKKIFSNFVLGLAFLGAAAAIGGLIGCIIGIAIALFNFFPWASILFVGLVVVGIAYLLSLLFGTEDEEI